MRMYVAGGALRNLLLGRPSPERDVVFQAAPDAFRKAYPEARPAGKSFPVFLLHGAEHVPIRGQNIHEDLLARDLTINALAMDEGGILYAHPSALADLKGKVLRPASSTAFLNDPVRVFRAARFAAELPDFTCHETLLTAMRDAAAAQLVATISADRVGKELRKALAAPSPGRFLTLLAATGCLLPWFAELSEVARTPVGPIPLCTGSILAHSAEVMDRLAPHPLHVWMGLTHALGMWTKASHDLPHSPPCSPPEASLAKSLAKRLRLPSCYAQAGEAAVRWHTSAARYPRLPLGSKVDLLMQLHALDLTEALFALVRADGGPDHLPKARQDLKRILAVKLPAEDRLQGPRSGERLQALRCQALDQ